MKTVIGNWKMNVGTRESVALVRGTLLSLKGKKTLPEIIICPPFVALGDVRKTVARSHVMLGAQDMFWEESGSYTGEISARMLKELHVSHVILGHSERRGYLGETDEMVNKKLRAALAQDLVPIVCVGETKEQHEDGSAKEVVEHQIKEAVKKIQLSKKQKIYFAYEPIWAIGTGVPAHPSDAVEMHALIRKVASSALGSTDGIRVMYGGSVSDENAYAFLRESEVDGVLVGGASVKLSQFKGVLGAAIDVIEGLSE